MEAKSQPRKCGQVESATGITSEGHPWTVLTGDVAVALREVQTASVDCVVTSPPYYWQRDYEITGQIGHERTIDGYVAALVRAFGELRRTLKPSGSFFLNLGDTYYSAKGRPHGKDDKHNGRQMMRRHLRAVDGRDQTAPCSLKTC
jgi:DNA modification methylase